MISLFNCRRGAIFLNFRLVLFFDDYVDIEWNISCLTNNLHTKKGAIGKRPPQNSMRFYKWLGKLTRFQMPIAMKRIYKVIIKSY